MTSKAKQKPRRPTTAFDLHVAIQALIENRRCPILDLDDEARTSGESDFIVAATFDLDNMGLDMASGAIFTVSIRKNRRKRGWTTDERKAIEARIMSDLPDRRPSEDTAARKAIEEKYGE